LAISAFTHILNGKVKQGAIVAHSCSSQLIIFEPVDLSIRKAVVIAKTPYNHPTFLHVKATYTDKELAREAFHLAGKTKVAANTLQTS
jgi:hypothetical protein